MHSAPPSHEVVHVYRTLSEFWKRGQLFVETLGPLAFPIGLLPIETQLAIQSACPVVVCLGALLLLGRFCMCHNDREPSVPSLDYILTNFCPASLSGIAVTFSIVGSFAAYHYRHLKTDAGTGVNTSKCIGNGLLVLLMCVCLPRNHRHLTLLRLIVATTLVESILAVSWLLGSAPSDVLFTHACLYFPNLYVLAKDLGDRSKSVSRLAAKAAVIHTWPVACFPLVAMLVTGFVFGWSETSAGGNYNLHYLPTTMRRELRPDVSHMFENPTVPPTVAPNSSTGYHLRSRVPFSIYLPSAGFLWSDNLVWDDKSQAFDIDGEVAPLDESMVASGLFPEQNHRVVFQDRINAMSKLITRPAN
jgi:hypothetical protein